jgi:hypothetical protein
MLSRASISGGLALLLILVFAFPAFAGGWAVITLDELPSNVVVEGQRANGCVDRGRGGTLKNGLAPTVTTQLRGEQIVVPAEADGKPGHYTATLTFPREGNWEWSIQAFTMDQPMPALTVTASTVDSESQPTSKTPSKPASISPLLMVSVLAFGIALVGLFLAFQRKSRVAGALAALCLMFGIGTFVTGAATPAVEAQGEKALDASSSRVEMGRQLFLAKGCITCHYNSRAADRNEYWTIEIGAPDLSNYSAHPEVLLIRLKDPTAAKSDTRMPDLSLKQIEIEALIAFINSK